MTIRMGDQFRDGTVMMQVYGFKIGGDDGRRMLVVTESGERSEIDPGRLMEECVLEPTSNPDAEVVFRS